jgi:hypothetical protein
MTCARQRRLEREAHEIARDECLESAEEFGLNMSCADEYECSAPLHCEFFKRALADVTAFDEALP